MGGGRRVTVTGWVRLPPIPDRLLSRAATAFLLILSWGACAAQAQTRGAELLREQKPAYPDPLLKANAQGNVILIARIDKNGKVQDVRPIWKSHARFVGPTLEAAKAWVFRPAVQDGRPIDIAANIIFPFRLRNEKGQAVGREIPGPCLHDLAIYPADGSGRKSAPEGFPIRNAKDAWLRVEASLDLPPHPNASRLSVIAEAVSPSHKRFPVFQQAVPVDAKATAVKLPFNAPVGQDWEDGVWLLRFTVDGAEAGGGQFWLARDPARFDFAAALRKLTL